MDGAYDDLEDSSSSLDTEILLSTSLPSDGQPHFPQFGLKNSLRLRRHSDDTDLLLQPMEVQISLDKPANSYRRPFSNMQLTSQNKKMYLDDDRFLFDNSGYESRKFNERERGGPGFDSKLYEEPMPFSAILAKHGISYDSSDTGTKGRGTTICRDAADRLLDDMDKQLDNVLLNNIHNQDVNDDPGTDLDSVRSLRNRVMSDLAAGDEYNISDTLNSETFNGQRKAYENIIDSTPPKRNIPSFRSASASRYDHRDKRNGVDFHLHLTTHSPTTPSVDEHKPQHDTRENLKITSARNNTDGRRGREFERSRDRRRLNESGKSWEPPLKLSLRDLDTSLSSSQRYPSSGPYFDGLQSGQSILNNGYSYPYSELSEINRSLGYTSPQRNVYMNRSFNYLYKPFTTKWHSTPIRPAIRGYSTQNVGVENDSIQMATRQKMKSESEDEYEKPKDIQTPLNNMEGESKISDKNGCSEIKKEKEELLSSSDTKQDEYEWRLKKMLKEQEIIPKHVEELYNREQQASVTQNSSTEASTVGSLAKGGQETKPIEENQSNAKKSNSKHSDNDGSTYSVSSISNVYKRTDYHEVPEFAANDTTKTTTSVCTEPSKSGHETDTYSVKTESEKTDVNTEKSEEDLARSASSVRNPDLPEEFPDSEESRSVTSQGEDVQVTRFIDSIVVSNKSIKSKTNSGSSSENSEWKLEENKCVESTSSDVLKEIKSVENTDSNNDDISESIIKGAALIDSKDNPSYQPFNSSLLESHISPDMEQDKEDLSSVHSESTLKDNTQVCDDTGSLDTDEVPSVLRRSLVRSPSDDHSSLEFTLHVSSTDLESLPTSEFENNWLKRQKTRFPELDPPTTTQVDDSASSTKSDDDPFSSLSPRTKKKLTKRERMKILLAASQRKRKRKENKDSHAEQKSHGDRVISQIPQECKMSSLSDSESLRSTTTDDLLGAGPLTGDMAGESIESSGGRQAMPRSSSVTSLSTVQTEDYEDRYKQMMVRHLAGVPLTSFDSVTIASDLDSVRTDAVHEHFLESMRKSKVTDSSAEADTDSSKQTNDSNRSQRLRDRFLKMKDQKTRNETAENGIDISASSKSARTPIKASYRAASPYMERKSDTEMLGNRMSRTNDSTQGNDSTINTNGVLPNRCRTPSKHSQTPNLQTSDLTSGHREHSPQVHNHYSRPQSRERLIDSTQTYYTNDTITSCNSTKPESRRSSHRSEGSEVTNERRRITSTAMNKLQELDSQIEEIEHKKKTSEQELKLMEKTMEGHRINLLKLEEKLRENQAKADDARTELMVLEFKKDQCQKELKEVSEEFGQVQEKMKETEDLGMSYDEIIALIQERDELRARFRRGEASRTTIAERQELERALHIAKEDLFRERKLTREKLEGLEEKLEDSHHNFELMESEKNTEIAKLDTLVLNLKKNNQTAPLSPSSENVRAEAIEAEKRTLFSKVEELKKQLQQKDVEIVSLATETNRKREENRELSSRISELESKISEQMELREKLIVETERNVDSMKKDKEQALESLKHEIEKVGHDIEKEKERAVLEYKSNHQEELFRLKSVIEVQKKELEQVRQLLQNQEESTRSLGEKLRMEAKEQVRSALAKDRLAWEQEKQVSDRREDDVRNVTFEKERMQWRREVEEARSKCKIATDQIAKLRAEVEEQRAEARKLHQEKLEAVSQAREQERKDQEKKLEQVRSEMEEINRLETVKHSSKCSRIEEELRALKNEKNEAVLKSKEATSRAERTERCFASEVHEECQKISDLIRGIRTPSQSRNRGSAVASRSSTHLSRSKRPSNSDGAVSQLRVVSDDIRATLRDLTTEVETHRRAAQIAQRERDRVLTNGGSSHPSKNSVSNSNQLSQQIAELNGQNMSEMKLLTKQLTEKDNELRDIQRNMSMWKDTTAQKLAQKFEEELELQIERKLGRRRLEHQRQIERLEAELSRFAAGTSIHTPMREYEAPPMQPQPINTSTSVSMANGTNDKSTAKLLRHLQGRVKQLRTENDLLRSNSQIMNYEDYRKSR